MNRRDFGKAVGAGLIGAVLPAHFVTAENCVRGAVLPTNDYVAFVHPSMWADFVSIHKRGQWADAHRKWRKAGKPGNSDAGSIWARFGRAPSPMADAMEIGQIESVRFIKTLAVA